MGVTLKLSSSYHSRTNGQSDKIVQYLGDLLRAFVLEQGGVRDDFMPFIEFTYNNNYHLSIGWHRSKHCMGGGVGLLFIDMSLERVRFLDQRLCIRLQRK